MNVIAEFLNETGCSQQQLADILSAIDPRIDQALISKMKTGVCLPTEAVVRCLCELMHRPSEGLLALDGVIYPPIEETRLKTENYGPLISALAGSSWTEPRSRAYLVSRLHMPDRSIRRLKEAATQDDVIIGSSSHGKGYYLAQTREDLLRIRREYTSRIRSHVKTLRAIDRALAQVPGQVGMDLSDGTIHNDGE